jgi:hypothetical protein
MNNKQIFEVMRDKQLAEINKQELEKQALRESERIERNDAFQEWVKCFGNMVKK